jgi:4-amino-4-deoxy-L-arabinose transferase-like glycosyltransferase
VRPRVPWRWVALFALLKVALHLATASNYGWHIDELYFLASSRHLDWGYVDYPPLVPLLARADQALFPGSLVALRALPALAGATIVVLTALIARELGAGSRAQAWAALMALLSPLYIGANVLFHTTTFDELTWAVALFVFVRLLRDGDPRLWLLLGCVMGIGLETKFTIAALGLAIFAGVLVTRHRPVLLTAWPWAAAAIALAMLAPNLAWQTGHDWISVRYALSHRGHTDGPVAFWAQQILLVGPLFVWPCVAGLLAHARDDRFAPLPLVALTVELVFFAAGGKSYYAGPVLPIAYATAAIWLDARLRTQLRSVAWVAASVALTVLLLPIGVPILPRQTFVASGLWKVRPDFANMFGGPELAQNTAAAYESIPADQRSGAMIVAHYYGEAGPIDLYGPALGLPEAVSPHLSYWYWAPPRMDPQTAVLVGFTAEDADRFFADCRQVTTITNDYGVANDFSGDPILVCTQPREPLWRAWPSLQTLD